MEVYCMTACDQALELTERGRVGEVQAHSHGRTSLLLFLCVLAGSVH